MYYTNYIFEYCTFLCSISANCSLRRPSTVDLTAKQDVHQSMIMGCG